MMNCGTFSWFYHWIEQLRRTIYADVSAGLTQLLEDCEYRLWIQTTAPNPKVAEKQLERIDEFCHWIKQLQENNQRANEPSDFSEIIRRLNLIDLLANNEPTETSDAIQLMTIHAAKGLEFPVVFVTGLVEGNLPNHNSLGSEDGVQEERRLAYVAITRAQRECILSYPIARKTHKNERQSNIPSRYLQEIPDDLFGADPLQLSATEKQQHKEHVLNRLQQMFAD